MKSRLTDFAICGGPPVFASPLAVGRPALPDRIRLLRRIESVLDSGQLTNGGPLVQEFEHRLQDVLRVRNVVVVCNGTTALQIMIAACGLTGEVIVPSFTFIATAHAVRWLGLTPVFADVDPSTHTLDVASVEQCISDQTSGVLGVHLWGNICDLAGLERLTNALGLHLLFDASHAFGKPLEPLF